MGEKKVTTMVLKVDLNCEKCRKKVKRILCKIPQIQDQVWDEKNNTVTIKLVCCNPEKIRVRIICKGGGSITCVKIVVPIPPKKPTHSPKPEKSEKPEKPEEPEKPPQKPTHSPKPEKPKVHEGPKPNEPPPCLCNCCSECYKGISYRPCFHGPLLHKHNCCLECYVRISGGTCFYSLPPLKHGLPSSQRNCCTECSEGISGGPCFYGHGSGLPPLFYQYNEYMGRPVYDSYGSGGQGCSVM